MILDLVGYLTVTQEVTAPFHLQIHALLTLKNKELHIATYQRDYNFLLATVQYLLKHTLPIAFMTTVDVQAFNMRHVTVTALKAMPKHVQQKELY